MTLCSTLVSALSSGQNPLLIQGEEKLPTFNQSQMLNGISFFDSMNETWLHIRLLSSHLKDPISMGCLFLFNTNFLF